MKQPLVLGSWEEVEERANILEDEGWEVKAMFYPILGQSGYSCTRTTEKLGTLEESFVFNIFGQPLQPITIPCDNDKVLLSFLWEHSAHGLTYFQTQKSEWGLICYCKAKLGQSYVLMVSNLSEMGWKAMKEYMQIEPKNQN